MTVDVMKKPDINAFATRICFFDRKKCVECGDCQATYYCDSFLDRVNTVGLPPLMDTRNCSGCGLCVQICEEGALHLYHPKEFIVLISSSEERKELLQSLNVPFLMYNPDKDLSRFPQPSIHNLISDNTDPDFLERCIETIWESRLADSFILGDGTEDYPDLRIERLDQCHDTACTLLDSITPDSFSHQNIALARAAVWSQLIWSDPGQVLWDSFILEVQTYLETRCGEDNWQPVTTDNTHLKPGNFNRQIKYRISSYIVLLRQGQVLLSTLMPHGREQVGGFFFSDDIFDNETLVNAYNEQEIGHGRLAGLDIRSCGHFLIKNFDNIDKDNRYAMAGLPWKEIRELLGNAEHTQHVTDFNEMCAAMRNRNE